MNALTRYHWPGNIREFENLIERFIVLSTSEDPIDLKDIPLEILTAVDRGVKESEVEKLGLIRIREAFGRRVIANVL
ncbi:MAG: hypothetical protein ABSB22_13180 [Thermodesulfobacteriota bacterium]